MLSPDLMALLVIHLHGHLGFLRFMGQHPRRVIKDLICNAVPAAQPKASDTYTVFLVDFA